MLWKNWWPTVPPFRACCYHHHAENHCLPFALPGRPGRTSLTPETKKLNLKDSFHHGQHLFDLLPSGRCCRAIKARTTKVKKSLFPWAIRTTPTSQMTLHLLNYLIYYSRTCAVWGCLFYSMMSCMTQLSLHCSYYDVTGRWSCTNLKYWFICEAHYSISWHIIISLSLCPTVVKLCLTLIIKP